MNRRLYPALVGLLFGLFQSGLFLQLTFTLSSSFETFLLVTICWLAGSAVGVLYAAPLPLPSKGFLAVSLSTYYLCALLPRVAPFNTQLWPLYAALIALAGLYAGVFFARMSQHYRARDLFFLENNGFIVGLVLGTILFLVGGRPALWIGPLVAAAVVAAAREPGADPTRQAILSGETS